VLVGIQSGLEYYRTPLLEGLKKKKRRRIRGAHWDGIKDRWGGGSGVL